MLYRTDLITCVSITLRMSVSRSLFWVFFSRLNLFAPGILADILVFTAFGAYIAEVPTLCSNSVSLP